MDPPNPRSAPEVFWYFVTHDGPAPWEVEGRRQIAFDDVKALAAAIDRLPYEGALLATTGHNVWVLGAAAAAITRNFKPLLAIRPQFISVTELANMVVSFNNLFDNRLLINVINSETPIWRQNGIWLENEQRFELHAEYWDVFQQLVKKLPGKVSIFISNRRLLTRGCHRARRCRYGFPALPGRRWR
ncbi:LLM class flavin-dependent oxidoreductase [Serratia liquefaciens]|nr:LLM class flavin-dependent oxidoreductase [Serratia liquefaciens]WBL75029.1 LLM class flavin-dependent oxidoreductase [Serratia liquefaciens]